MSKKRQKQIESQITLGFLCVVFLFFLITGGSLPETIGLTIISSFFVIGLLIYLAIQRKRNLRRLGISEIGKMTGIYSREYNFENTVNVASVLD
ncbi:hypothetical protein IHV10_10425 [Fictibacillus sp. 5RED26]|uniref:hypothetical protein n=1 Tax=Fictibacillus sp. 5RED26 TaxID=2745876 RepID=UPI0018CF1CC9|nr:hypothetical protein [Fictibacillus sp. 5RED26]MBH0156783.1 hypothetical protein [Fictibacillus sp. 5RED26]